MLQNITRQPKPESEAILQAKGNRILKTATDSFQQGWQEALTGQVKPITELWDGIDKVISLPSKFSVFCLSLMN